MSCHSISTYLTDLQTQNAVFCRVVVDVDTGDVRAYETVLGSLVAKATMRDAATYAMLYDLHGVPRFHLDARSRWACLKHTNQLPTTQKAPSHVG